MITLEQARKILPEDYKISDKDLSAVLSDAYVIARLAAKSYLREKQLIIKKNYEK